MSGFNEGRRREALSVMVAPSFSSFAALAMAFLGLPLAAWRSYRQGRERGGEAEL